MAAPVALILRRDYINRDRSGSRSVVFIHRQRGLVNACVGKLHIPLGGINSVLVRFSVVCYGDLKRNKPPPILFVAFIACRGVEYHGMRAATWVGVRRTSEFGFGQ